MTASTPKQSFRSVACMILLASTFRASVVAAAEDRGTSGVCCLLGQCLDDTAHDTLAECEADGGFFIADTDCQGEPCPVCPFNSSVNCQQVQTIFGLVPYMDRNPVNGPGGEKATVLADDVKFGGVVDEICWNTGFYQTPCCQTSCVQSIDDTWEIRIYETDVGCPAIPGAEVAMSTIAVLSKLEGTGAGTGTWHYSGMLNTPIELPNGGFNGDTYWFEVSGYGEPGCEVHATWSRDDGNKHHAVSTWTAPEPDAHAYSSDQIGSVDVGFCENSGLGSPPDVLGACCNCPEVCTEDMTQKDCVQNLRGRWSACIDCADPSVCPGVPVNDDCASPLVITSIPTDGSEFVVEGDNICATNDGPGLMAGDGGCASSLHSNGNLHHDVWYSYVAEACGELTVDSCVNDADFDQMIAVYDATNGCPLLRSDEIGCGDDGCGIGAGPSKVTVNVEEGQELLIRVGGWGIDIPESFMPNPRGEFILRFSFDENCPPCLSPTSPVVPPHNIRKNRYISIVPDPCDSVLGTSDILLTFVSTQVSGVTAIGASWWATAPINGAGLSPATCISVVSSTRPTTPPDWTGCSTVHLTGCPIIPTSTYHIRTVLDGFVSDPPLVAETQAKPREKWHGDCVGFFNGTEWTPPNGVTSIDDAVAAIKTFQDPNAPNATHLSVTDVHPNLNGQQINLIVSIADVFVIILAFRGQEYPGPQMERCP